MSVLVNSCLGWLRRNLAWSNSRQSWQERMAFVVLFAGAGGLWWAQRWLSAAQAVVLWGLLLTALAVLLRRGWLKLFGPVLLYDLICLGRRSRYFYFRILYASLLFGLLGWVYLMWVINHRQRDELTARQMADFAALFFYMFMGVQFVVAVLLTPAYTAGAIAEEKDRRTLEFLLATDLRNREIVLSKLAARLANITLVILTGLPILSFLQFLGGVDPNLVLTGFAATALTVASLAGLSILNSTLTRKPRDAIALTYLGGGAYLLLSAMSQALLLPTLGVANFPSTTTWTSPVTVADVVQWFSAGNIVIALIDLSKSLVLGPAVFDRTLLSVFRSYAIFHGILALACPVWAVLRLRAVALKEMYGKVQRLPLLTRLVGRPRVGHFPMIWKELHAEPKLRQNWLARLIVGILIVGSFVPVVFIMASFLRHLQQPATAPGFPFRYSDPYYWLAQNMNIWVRIVGTVVAGLLLLSVAVRAASSISGERDRQTLDSLLTTPLDSNAILFGKWLGSILSVRWAWLWLGLIWALGVVTGGLHVLALPILIAAWYVYAAVYAGIGLWFSAVSRTTLRATIWTLLTIAAVSVGHWLVMGLVCYFPLSAARANGDSVEYLAKFQMGQTPPVVLCWLALQGTEFENSYGGKYAVEITAFCILGILCWAALAAFVWTATSLRFRTLSGRTILPRPDRLPVPRLDRQRPSRPPPQRPVGLTGAVLVEEVLDVIPVEEDPLARDGKRAPGRE